MSYSARVTEQSSLEGVAVVANTIGSAYTDAIDLGLCRRHVFVVTAATLSGGATVDFGVYTATTSAGSYTALTGCSIATESTGNKAFPIEVATEFVKNAVPTAAFMKGYVQVKVAAGSAVATVRGHDPAQQPPGDTAAVAQTVNVIYA